MVIAPPTHIENHLLGYRPVLGFDGADHLADMVYTTATLGMEKHLIDMFGDAGLEYDQGPKTKDQEPPPVATDEGTTTGFDAHLTAQEDSHAPSSLVIGPSSPVWTAEASALLKKVPFFVRGKVQRNVERYATGRGQAEITADVLQEARESLGG
jgi:light-independent protochlorophyllide reductase subunit B